MTVQQAIDKFNVLQDKYGSPLLLDTEVASFLDMAQQERLNRLFPDDMGGVVNVEQDENVTFNIKNLIHYLAGSVSLSSNGNGKLLTYSDINTAIDTNRGSGTNKLFRILNVYYQGNPVKYTKHNNLLSNQTNAFKEATDSNPRYTVLWNGLEFYPNTIDGTFIQLTVIRNPDSFLTLYNANPTSNITDWDDYNMNLVIMIALQLAGISTRDEELLMDIRNTQTTK